MSKAEIESLQRLQAHYSHMVDTFADILKQLVGEIPEGSTFTFAVRTVPIVEIQITEHDTDCCMGMFMKWHDIYLVKLKQTNKLLGIPTLVRRAVSTKL
jgi:hypothetical protein